MSGLHDTETYDEGRDILNREASWAELAASSGRSPCEVVIKLAEATNYRNHHENSGFLSFKAGFMPLQAPLKRLPLTFEPWDTVGAALPRLLKHQSLRASIDAMPVLSAAPEALSDPNLLRASTLLSILAHAYMNLEGSAAPITLPPCIERPWSEISNRLGRSGPILSYIDLIVYNWQRNSDEQSERLRVENMRLLVPTVDNLEEHIFYLTQTEILAEATPLINGIVEAQNAILKLNPASLTLILEEMTKQVCRIGRRSMMKISANSARKPRVDPVVWAKTVAPLAVPIRPNVQGPGGTASPLFHMMDTFLGREDYNSTLGQEAQKIRATYPPNWRDFVEAAGAISISDYVAKANSETLDAAWCKLKEAYRGQQGLLGLHRRKVYAFLPMAFKVGRDLTIAGFQGQLAQEEWVKVNNELELSRRQRYYAADIATYSTASQRGIECSLQIPRYTISQLAQHCNSSKGYWFAAAGHVYDATSYIRFHPGGDKILLNSAGRDVTSDLYAVSHFQISTIRSKLAKFIIGKLQVRLFVDEILQQVYNCCIAIVYKAVDLQTTYRNDVDCLSKVFTSSDANNELTPQKLRFFIATQERVRIQYIPTLAAHLLSAACAIRRISRGGCALDQLVAQLNSIQTSGKCAISYSFSDTWSVVRQAMAETDDFLDSVRTNSITLLTIMEAIEENEKVAQQASLEKIKKSLELIADSLVQVV